MTEKLIEKKLREGVKRRGGLALKFASPFYTGMPDRLVLMPGRKIFWAELKSTGKQLRPTQKASIEILKRLGFEVSVIDTQDKLDNFLNQIEDDI
jgi:hypothetical protein